MEDEKLMQALRALPRERTMLLPALLTVQNQLGYLPRWAMEKVGKWLRVPKSEVYGAATSYASLRVDPPPKHVVKVCCGPGCRMNGSGRLMQKAEERLGVGPEDGKSDGGIVLDKTDCAFVCALAPVLQVDGVVYGRVTEDEVQELLRSMEDQGGQRS